MAVIPISGEAAAAAKPAVRTAHAAQSVKPNALYEWVHGVPNSLRRGGTIVFSLWYKQTSRHTISVDDYYLGLMNTTDPRNPWSKGLSIQLLDPTTHKWITPAKRFFGPSGVDWPYVDGGIPLKPNAVGHVYLRVTFGRTARLGRWVIQPQIGGWSGTGGLDYNTPYARMTLDA
ncbi:hypothetical protein DN069_02920 [Streptacidiphilus pinicola]|uniref:Uncharacterized protein n=2 Tax=Streptacidiphilus pinicola TaxID=2219663 RepID=A0A2X0KJJ9_9ACTN|nr:hypothetical protein DN069_02920 [Streptacidiphilus pinicola]